MTITTSDLLSGLLVTALTGNTGAGANVFAPRDWPTSLGVMPIILVNSPSERKESLGRNVPQFTVTTTIRVVGRLTAAASTGDAGAGALQAALGVLQRQIEVAVINSYDLTKLIQQFAFVEVQNKVTSDAEQHVGELTMDFGLEFYQGPEAFFPTASTPLQELRIYSDLVNVFDPTGTYPSPPFPGSVQPAPRTQGPDGRVEGGGLDITLPQ
jgi:hypothetical protein